MTEKCTELTGITIYTSIQNFGVSRIFLKAFIQQGWIKLIKSYIKDIYNVTEDFYFY